MPGPHHDPDAQQPADDDATVIPFPRTPDDATAPSTRDRRWRVTRMDTEPMTDQQYEQAVSALAALITHWMQEPENTNEIHKEEAA